VARGHVFTQLLGVFNEASVGAQEQFGALRPLPPVECLYETQKTSVGGTGRTVSMTRNVLFCTQVSSKFPMDSYPHTTHSTTYDKARAGSGGTD
jgi:hypothetical protein